MNNAEVYTKDNCRFCVEAKNLLDKRGIPYTEIAIADNRDALFERVIAASGVAPRTAPQIFLNELYIGGHSELVKHFVRLDATEE